VGRPPVGVTELSSVLIRLLGAPKKGNHGSDEVNNQHWRREQTEHAGDGWTAGILGLLFLLPQATDCVPRDIECGDGVMENNPRRWILSQRGLWLCVIGPDSMCTLAGSAGC
jgi:hypothetical protein